MMFERRQYFDEIMTIYHHSLKNWLWLKSRQYGSHALFITMQGYKEITLTLRSCNTLLEDEDGYLIYASRATHRYAHPAQGDPSGS